jgi:hypothetical protein
MEDLTKSNRFSLLENYFSLDQNFSIIHIDGRHTEASVDQDLDFASNHLAFNGVMIIDDFKHDYFPGVASSMFKFIQKSNYRLFMVSERKAYICHKEYHETFYKFFLESTPKIENIVNIVQHYDDKLSLETGYIQETDVNGYPVLLCLGQPR